MTTKMKMSPTLVEVWVVVAAVFLIAAAVPCAVVAIAVVVPVAVEIVAAIVVVLCVALPATGAVLHRHLQEEEEEEEEKRRRGFRSCKHDPKQPGRCASK
jgi:hypothetical protein